MKKHLKEARSLNPAAKPLLPSKPDPKPTDWDEINEALKQGAMKLGNPGTVVPLDPDWEDPEKPFVAFDGSKIRSPGTYSRVVTNGGVDKMVAGSDITKGSMVMVNASTKEVISVEPTGGIWAATPPHREDPKRIGTLPNIQLTMWIDHLRDELEKQKEINREQDHKIETLQEIVRQILTDQNNETVSQILEDKDT